MEQECLNLDIPGGLQILPTQVAGHTFDLKTLGLLQDSTKRFVYKPLGKPECGERELQFYETLQRGGVDKFGEQCTLLAEALTLTPKFYNKLKLLVNQREHIFLKLEDLTCGMSLPCIMDIKIGKQTWDPLADKHKRTVEQQKYAQCKQVLGLCVPGFQVYVPTVNGKVPQLVRYGKEYGKKLNAADFSETMAMFLNRQRLPCEALLHELLRQLEAIQTWFSRQTLYHFYASSLLVLYDLEQLIRLKAINPPPIKHNDQSYISNGNSNNAQPHYEIETDHDHQTVPAPPMDPKYWVRVRMIDFAHVFPSENGELDQNYLFGLQNLIAVIKSLLR